MDKMSNDQIALELIKASGITEQLKGNNLINNPNEAAQKLVSLYCAVLDELKQPTYYKKD